VLVCVISVCVCLCLDFDGFLWSFAVTFQTAKKTDDPQSMPWKNRCVCVCVCVCVYAVAKVL